MEIVSRRIINKIVKETIKDYSGVELYISDFPTDEKRIVTMRGIHNVDTYLHTEAFTLLLDVKDTYIKTTVLFPSILYMDTRIFNMNGEKLFNDSNTNGKVLVDKSIELEKTGFLFYQMARNKSFYTHYEVIDGKLEEIQKFDHCTELQGKAALSICDRNQLLTYHYKKGIADPYNFFTEYKDTFLGTNYNDTNKHVGIGTVTEGENTHTIIGIVDSKGILVSPLLDWNTSNEYGLPYMDPSMFDDSIDEIRNDMINENRLQSLENVKRAKINMKIMHCRNNKI